MKIPYFNNGGRFVVKYEDGGWWKSGVKYNTGMSASDYAKAIANKLYNAENLYKVSGNSSGLDLAKRIGYTGHINKSVSDLTNLILGLPGFSKNYNRWLSNNTAPKVTSTPASKTTATYTGVISLQPKPTTTTTPQPTIQLPTETVPSVNYYERNRDRLSNNYNSAYWTQHNADAFNQSLNSSNFNKDLWNINFQGKDTNIIDALSNMYGDTYKGRRFAKRLAAGNLKAKDFRRLGQAQAAYNRNLNLNNLNSNLEATPQLPTTSYSDVFNMTTGKVNQPSASYKAPPIDSSLDGSPDYTDKFL